MRPRQRLNRRNPPRHDVGAGTVAPCYQLCQLTPTSPFCVFLGLVSGKFLGVEKGVKNVKKR